eukprot:c4481_g1_i1.p1 GENE.c4481_g1_i1~~c4481_g1_i1.p1  ORF type:complete len:179 (+),score=31.14 c4481_g1_i1:35-538(+)
MAANAGSIVALVFAGIVALEHVYIFMLEAFWWRTRGRRAFKTTEDYANQTAAMAANQGLYNFFLAAGIVYGLLWQDAEIILLNLTFVVCAATFGATSVSPHILLVQGAPAILALLLMCFLYNEHDSTIGSDFNSRLRIFAASTIAAVSSGGVGYVIGSREQAYARMK